MKFELVSKMEAAERIIKVAIRLFFERRDPIAVHSLISAAHQVLYDIGRKQGLKGIIKNDFYIREEKWKEHLDIMNEARNFFKHADRDPEKRLKFYPGVNEHWILDSIDLYKQINGEAPFEFRIFWAWFCLKYPDLIEEGHLQTIFFNTQDRKGIIDDFDLICELLDKQIPGQITGGK